MLARIDGVGNINVFGAREYSMRVWLDPDRLAYVSLTAGDVVRALARAKRPSGRGHVGRAADGVGDRVSDRRSTRKADSSRRRSSRTSSSRRDENSVVRVKDVGRVELGARDYITNSYLDGKPAIALAIFQRPGSNALATAAEIQRTMAELAEDFPAGLAYRIVYNPTEFIQQSVDAVYTTIVEAVLLVIFVIVLFLQSWRAAAIPIVAIPVSLIGTFAVMAALGFSLNNLDAVRLGARDRHRRRRRDRRRREHRAEPRERARRSRSGARDDDRSRAGPRFDRVGVERRIRADGVPRRHLGRILSAIRADDRGRDDHLRVRLADAEPGARRDLAAPRRRRKAPASAGSAIDCSGRSSGASTWGSASSARATRTPFAGSRAALPRRSSRSSCCSRSRRSLFRVVPQGFIPQQDQGYVIVIIELPKGASLARTDAVVRRASDIVLRTPGADRSIAFAGFSAATFANASNAGAIFVGLEPFAERAAGDTAAAIVQRLWASLAEIQDAQILVVEPPPVRGIGNAGGFKMMLQDRAGRGLKALEQSTFEVIAASNRGGIVQQVYSTFSTSTPQYYLDIDRTKAEMLNVPVESIFETLQIYLGSIYVNDFNLFGRSYRVTAQADGPFRLDPTDIARLRARSTTGAMVPLGSVLAVRSTTGPDRVVRHNLYPATEIQGSAAPGISSGDALTAMESLAATLAARRLELRVVRARVPAAPRRRRRPADLPAQRSVRLPAADVSVRKLVAAVCDHRDRAAVHSLRAHGRLAARPRQQHPDADRLHRADRPREQERHLDRRVREAARGRGRRPVQRRDSRRAAQAAAHPDDVVRVHPRRRAVGRWRRARAPRCGSRSARPYSAA